MFTSKLLYQKTIDAPIDAVFAVLSDHEGMSRWPGLTDVALIAEGTPRNGLGAVRRVKVMGLTLDEAVVRWDPPRGFDYRIIAGLPVEHLGTVELEATEAGTLLTWRIRLHSWVPLLAPVILARLRAGLPAALDHVEGCARRLQS